MFNLKTNMQQNYKKYKILQHELNVTKLEKKKDMGWCGEIGADSACTAAMDGYRAGILSKTWGSVDVLLDNISILTCHMHTQISWKCIQRKTTYWDTGLKYGMSNKYTNKYVKYANKQ